MSTGSKTIVAPLLAWASGLRFPWLVAITAALFFGDVLFPDVIPLIDEIVLGLLTIVLASFRRKRQAPGTAAPDETRSQ